MTDVSSAFDDLQQVASSINQLTDQINKRIAGFEKSLFDLKLGLSCWTSKPIDTPDADGWGTHLGWTKGTNGEWGLYLRRQKRFSYEDQQSRLRDATRENRCQALNLFPDLVVELKAEAESVLKELQGAVDRKIVPQAKA